MADDDEAAKGRPRNNAFVLSTLFRITGSLVTMAVLLFAIRTGFELARGSSRRYATYADWAFHIGVLTMVLGILFLVVGLPILADLFMNLSEQMQKEAGIQKGTETQAISRASAQIISIITILSMLWWVIYTGFKLASEHRRDNKYYWLTISIGVTTVTFGFVYFIIGLGILVDQVIDLSAQVQQRKKKRMKHHYQG
ncbi:unnamed protein product [Linum trigynum]|uniref:Uncharacterized protein n=1 Tax=Linum trigynum TaxID=586398 RepID=A0AAV2EGJ1_9ROSI